MLDRRRAFRARVYFGGRIAFNARHASTDCIVRNASPLGARLEFAQVGLLPDQMDLLLKNNGTAYLASLIWQRSNQCGVVFRGMIQANQLTLDVAIRLRAAERTNASLRQQIETLRGFG